MPGCSKSCGETATLGARAAQDSYLHPDARRSFARLGRVALHAGRMVMGSIVVRGLEPELSVADCTSDARAVRFASFVARNMRPTSGQLLRELL